MACRLGLLGAAAPASPVAWAAAALLLAASSGLGLLMLGRAAREERRVRLGARAAGWVFLAGGVLGFSLSLARLFCGTCPQGRGALPPWHPQVEERQTQGDRT